MEREYQITLTAGTSLSDSDTIVLHDDQWNVAEYGLGHIGKLVRTLFEDSPRRLRSWYHWVDDTSYARDNGHGWGAWMTHPNGRRVYISATISPVYVPESEWAGLGER